MRGTSVPVGRVVVMVGIAWLAAAPARAQTDEGIRVETDAVELGIGGRVQTQFNTTSVEAEPESQLFLRRVRLELDLRVNDLVSGRLQPDFAGDEVSLKDVYLQLDLSPGLALRTGKFYRPFSLLLLTSSTRILPIERGAVIRGVRAWDENELVDDLHYGDRDIGVSVLGAPEGAPLGLAYEAGIFRGPAHQVQDVATYQYAARATIEPAEALRLGAAWSNRAFARDADVVGQDLRIERGNAFEVDVEYGTFARGPHLLAEVALGDFDALSDQGFLGAQAWLAYRTAPVGRVSGIEPILRVSYGDVDREEGLGTGLGGTLVTPGINVHLGGRNRLMLNYDLWLGAADAEDASSLKAMFQLAF